MSRYRKLYAAATAAIITTLTLLWDGNVPLEEAVALVTTWSGVGAVWLFPNEPST